MSPDDAFALLQKLNAPPELLHHAKVVHQAAQKLIACLKRYPLNLDTDFILVGVVLHDAGKILYPQELHQPGNEHEAAGAQLLKANGVEPRLAQVCISHSRWQGTSLEEHIISLGDKLWKSKRDALLENTLIDLIAAQLGLDRWDIFISLDNCFESLTGLNFPDP
jgi:putative nucleotidyltransferase with HDIG domain